LSTVSVGRSGGFGGLSPRVSAARGSAVIGRA
jgi:hypothetical protein